MRACAVRSASEMVVPPVVADAAKAGNVTAVREWLESGGDPNDTDGRGCTPLIRVVGAARVISEAHLDVARLLLSHTVRTSINPTRTRLPPYIVVPFSQSRAVAGPSSSSFSMPALM